MKNKYKSEIFFEAGRTLIAILVALSLALVIILLISKQPADAISGLLLGPLSSLRRMGNVVQMSIPLIFTGLAVCIMFRANQFNMIGEGAFFVGGLIAAQVAIKLLLPAGIHPLAAILAGGLAGAVAGLIPGILKSKWNTNEFVISLMMNFVLFYIGTFVVDYTIKDPTAASLASLKLSDTAKLPVLIDRTKIHAGIFIAVLMIVLVYYFIFRTRWGYAIRMTGINKDFAAYAGINTAAVIIYAQVLGGFVAGVGGATEILGMYDRFQWQALPGYGFDGIIVAILARQNPLLIPIGAIFLAYLRVGADIMAQTSDVANEVTSIVQASMILLIAAKVFLAGWRHRMLVRQSKDEIAAKGEN